MIKSWYHSTGFLYGLLFLDLWSFHINMQLFLALKVPDRQVVPLRLGQPSSCCCLNQKQVRWLTVLERWAKALMWSSSSYMISRSSPVLWPGLQISTERMCHSEIFNASLLSSLLTNQKCLMRNVSRLVGKQPWQMICWCDGTLCSKWWVRIIVCLDY